MRKKTLLYMAALLSLFSCKVDDGSVNLVDATSLRSYGNDVVLSYVMNGIDLMRWMVEVDRFGSLSSDEQKESPLYGTVLHLDDNTLEINGGISSQPIRVLTGGKSLLEEGASWRVENFKVSYSVPELNAVVSAAGDRTWEISLEAPLASVEAELTVVLDDTPGFVPFSGEFSVSGRESSPEGYISEFCNDGRCVFGYLESTDENTMPVLDDITGTVAVDIYKDGKRNDWCILTYSKGALEECLTSRD